MKKQLKMLVVLGICILMGGCTMNRDVLNNGVKGMKERSVNVHTEEEMKAYALQKLEEKYGQSFEIASVLKYGHEDGEENRPMYLNGYAHVMEDDSLDCYFVVTEPNGFKDDYATNYYDADIQSHLKQELSDVPGNYEIFVSYDLTDKTFDPNMDYKKYLMSKQCCIDYTVYVSKSDDAHEYIPVIRAWMEKLYGADYDWYFELRDKEDKEKCYFTLDPGDNGFNSALDWEDELIYDYIQQ